MGTFMVAKILSSVDWHYGAYISWRWDRCNVCSGWLYASVVELSIATFAGLSTLEFPDSGHQVVPRCHRPQI